MLMDRARCSTISDIGYKGEDAAARIRVGGSLLLSGNAGSGIETLFQRPPNLAGGCGSLIPVTPAPKCPVLPWLSANRGHLENCDRDILIHHQPTRIVWEALVIAGIALWRRCLKRAKLIISQILNWPLAPQAAKVVDRGGAGRRLLTRCAVNRLLTNNKNAEFSRLIA